MSFGVGDRSASMLTVAPWSGGTLPDERHSSAWPRPFLGEAAERWLHLPDPVPRLPEVGRDAGQQAQ